MAEKKNQHYVPKMLLRPFGYGLENRQIDLYHIASRRFIPGAPIKTQCSRDYFYGQDGVIEGHLGQMEGEFAAILQQARSSDRYDLTRHPDIVSFVSLQLMRTYQKAQEMQIGTEKMMKLQMYGQFDEDILRQVHINMDGLPAMMVQMGLSMAPILWDLKPFLIVNRTARDFVISDTPVLQTNRFCRAFYPHVALTGGARSGLQLFVPIGPRHGLLLHDSQVYTLPSAGNVLVLTKPGDVEKFNRLQWKNAYQNLYLTSGADAAYLAALTSVARSTEPLAVMDRFDKVEQGHRIGYTATSKDEYAGPSDGVTEELLRLRFRELDEDIALPGLTVRPKPQVFDNGSAVGPIRDGIWRQITMDFDAATHDGRFKYSQLPLFVAQHPLRPHLGAWTQRPELSALFP